MTFLDSIWFIYFPLQSLQKSWHSDPVWIYITDTPIKYKQNVLRGYCYRPVQTPRRYSYNMTNYGCFILITSRELDDLELWWTYSIWFIYFPLQSLQKSWHSDPVWICITDTPINFTFTYKSFNKGRHNGKKT
jgi:3'-phosphoadenosine 5'-phosphosulfate sulfotransferase (PAPS reductase)/FAD synthetase